MARHNDRKVNMVLESLESRNLQSALGTDAALSAVPPVTPNSAVIAPSSPQLQANIGTHNYHGVTGFFGQ